MTVKLRVEAPGDAAAIRAVNCAAFPTEAEADLVEALRADGDAAISLVAEDNDEIVGHVLLSTMQVSADGRAVRAAGLAPVAVVPGRQAQGIGSALVRSAIDAARAQGFEMLFLLGEPEYYGRFGFSVEAAAPFASPYAGPYFQALMLEPAMVSPKAGDARYARAFSDLG
ncbi:GNAT family N-acetyltransferase [Sphingomonas cavernae]|uniref:N-acetyltransferase n=1 Tax=Sphingomonas cavernae TaxID=2320861 RepID=A0A418WPX3_9SPHN|nr:N-acetyltransferase [Sphingomonas cavernae]RJF93298.1 N-acetyltransferase [Sphingomonas cavernae]